MWHFFCHCFYFTSPPYLSLFWCLGRVVLRDCTISWLSSLIFSCTVCVSLFDLQLGVIGGLCSVTEALPGHLISPFSASGRVCFVIVAFPGYLH